MNSFNFTKNYAMKNVFFGLISLITFSLFSQEIKLEEIMKGNEFIGHQAQNHRWSWDSKRIYFDWNPKNELGNSTYFWEKGMKEPKLLPKEEFKDLYVFNEHQENKKIRYYLKDGALFSFDTQKKTHNKLIHTQDYISDLQVNINSDIIYFKQNNNLYKFDTKTNTYQQITNFKAGKKPNISDETSFLEEQQKELFQFIQDKNKKKSWNEEKYALQNEQFPKAFYYQNQEIENIQISDDEKFVLFRLSTYPSDLETSVEHQITSTGYTKSSKAREKVSINALSSHKLAIYNIEKDSVYMVSFSSLSDIRKNPSYLSLYSNFNELSEKDKEIVMHKAVFNDIGTHCIIDIKSLDNKDRWIVRLDLKKNKIEELEHQHDPAWIGGPGISEWNFEEGTLGFLKDNETIYFQSEETGFSHLYALNVLTKKKKQLTVGEWEVRSVKLSKDKNYFYLGANKSHPGNLEFYKLDINSLKLESIFVEEGANDVVLSPDEKSFAILYSTKNKPWELYFAENKVNPKKTQITFSTTDNFNAISWKNPELISFEASDKTKVYARVYSPEKKNGAAVIFVHGAGYLQNAHNFWSSYYREYMFHNLLVQKGFTVLDIDYRASDGYGRDFRTGIYREMGGLDLSDNLDGRKLLIEKYGIDSNRVGIYGGSYGGFITLMALLKEPGKFKCGAALRSVTDWAHYNLEYTSNILNFPETDPEAYRKSSPIYYAENLQDKLLMLHGMVDDNVQFQDITRISQRFIELGKQNWELAVFPVEAHGFKTTSSWLDEYRRILKLFEENLLK
jgi:dipeptidyl aminopeptidase/acylaminoacyl peptidase